ncbi:MAG: hypothetical protein ABIJ25_07465 [Pseudomonadota bacterium]
MAMYAPNQLHSVPLASFNPIRRSSGITLPELTYFEVEQDGRKS